MPVTSVLTTEDASRSILAGAEVRRRIRWFVSCSLVGGLLVGGIAYALTPMLAHTYAAESRLVLDRSSNGSPLGNTVSVPADPATASQVLTSQDVDQKVS